MLSWGNYWKENPKLFMKVMEKSTEYVAKQLLIHELIDQSSQILDFGCGPGYLANALKGEIKNYYGVDISSVYIKNAREKCKDYPNFLFLEVEMEQSIQSLGLVEKEGQKFDTIIILSVVQYFDNKETVLELLSKCRSLLQSGGKILLVDIIAHENGLLKDAFGILIHSIKMGYFFSFLKFMVIAKQSKYNTLRKKHKLLMLTPKEVFSMAQQLGMKAIQLPRITMQRSRISYCLVS